MPKVITIIEYSLFDALQIICKINYSVNGGKIRERFYIDEITKIEYANEGKKDVSFNHRNKNYQTTLGSDLCILMGDVK